MIDTGVVREIDSLGRIVVPKELRKIMGIDSGEKVEIFTENNFVMLRKYEPRCVLCGEAHDVEQILGENAE